jgi:hypothetical protein
MRPVLTHGDYVFCFAAHPEEDTSMRYHFIKECGWTAAQYRSIKDFEWFRVEVSLWLNGQELGTDHLGCCCYESEDEFWSTYAEGYFADMVHELAHNHDDPALKAWADQWRENLRAKT